MLSTVFEHYLKDRRGVFHVGGHTGEELDWYEEQGFTGGIWFEPNKELFPVLQSRLKRYDHHRAFNLGIHDTLQKAVLHIANNNGQSSSILDLGTHRKYYPEVKYIRDQEIELMRMDDFLKSHFVSISQFNFLNVDVQGVELNVIKSFGGLIDRLDYIYTEVNEEELYVGIDLLPAIDTYLEGFGFCRAYTYMTRRRWGDAFYIKKNLL